MNRDVGQFQLDTAYNALLRRNREPIPGRDVTGPTYRQSSV